MNGYLVVMRCLHDDLPMGIFWEKCDAMLFAQQLVIEPCEPIVNPFGGVVSEPVGIGILKITNGFPDGFELIANESAILAKGEGTLWGRK